MDELDLAAALCSRLCHDLVGPVSAISNGIELMEDDDDPEMAREALSLLSQSARDAANRLKFFRLAFGASGGAEIPIPYAEVRQAAEACLIGPRVGFEWAGEALGQAPADKRRIRLLANLCLIASAALGRGGVVRCELGVEQMTVVASSERGELEADVVSALQGEPVTISPRSAPAILVRRTIEIMGARFTLATEPGTALMRADWPD